MQFDTQKSFGFPVLRPGSSDYTGGSTFQPNFKPELVDNKSKVQLKITFSVSVPEIKKLIEAGKAKYVAVIDCRDTLLRKGYSTFDTELVFEEEVANIYGSFFIETYIVATQTIVDFKSIYFNEDFDGIAVKFEQGMPIAQGRPFPVNTKPKKYRSLQSCFKVITDNTLKDGYWYYEAETEFPEIFVNKNQKEIFHRYPSSTFVNTILVPVVSKMIDLLQNSERKNEFESYEWASLIKEKLALKGFPSLDKEQNSTLLAQYVLDAPMRWLNNDLEE